MSEILVNSLKTAAGVNTLSFDSTGDVLLATGKIGRVAGNTIQIDSGGNLNLPGSITGSSLFTNKIDFNADGDTVATFNRTTSNGSIIEFQQDDSTMGVIGGRNGSYYLGSGDTGIKFISGSDAVTAATTTDGSGRDAAIDLGGSGTRFKDLYLSGGISFDAGSNYLSDYEAGGFTVTSTRNGVGEDISNWRARYVKVGNLVHISIATDTYVRHAGSGYGSSDAFLITSNLPFTPDTRGGSQIAHSRSLATPEKLALCWESNSTAIILNQAGVNNSYNPTNNVITGTTQTNITLMWSGSYYTAS